MVANIANFLFISLDTYQKEDNKYNKYRQILFS